VTISGTNAIMKSQLYLILYLEATNKGVSSQGCIHRLVCRKFVSLVKILWKDTVLAIREKSRWVQCRGTKPLLINLSLSTFKHFEGQATS
jgi:hypothetical protein